MPFIQNKYDHTMAKMTHKKKKF